MRQNRRSEVINIDMSVIHTVMEKTTACFYSLFYE